MKIKYDRFGRMLYNSEFHSKNGTGWTEEDIQYLIDWYYIIGPEEISFALDRTVGTIMYKANKLRIQGKLIKPKKLKYQRRMLNNE